MSTAASKRRLIFGATCIQCANELIAPERSEYRYGRQVRHVWHCWKCECCFETQVYLSPDAEPMVA